MDPEETLQSVGFNEKESAVYLACLELGQETVANIAKKAGVKRPTVYLILESLQAQGLINTSTRGKRTLYGAEDPVKLMGMLARKQRDLKTVLPYLQAINNQKTTKPRVRFYAGRDGLLQIYEEGFQAKEMRFWGSMEAITKDFRDVAEWFIKVSNRTKLTTFDLLTDTPEDRAYARRVIRPGYQIRFFPRELRVTTDSMIFDNKISLVAFEPEPHGLIIESEHMTNSFRSLWELAWRNATVYRL